MVKTALCWRAQDFFTSTSQEDEAEHRREDELERAGERLQDRVEVLEEEAGDDAHQRVVEDDGQHQEVADRAQGARVERRAQLAAEPCKREEGNRLTLDSSLM